MIEYSQCNPVSERRRLAEAEISRLLVSQMIGVLAQVAALTVSADPWAYHADLALRLLEEATESLHNFAQRKAIK